MVLCALVVSLADGSGPSAAALFKQGRKAERSGDVVRAYLLYSQAAALDPSKPEYWGRSQALRTQAALKARPLPKLSGEVKPHSEPAPGPPPKGFSTEITDRDLEELRRLRPPPDLKPAPGRKDLDLNGNPRALYERVARAWGLEVVFDGDYEPRQPVRLSVRESEFQDTLDALNAAASAFVIPLSEKLFMVAQDTQQKRADLEPTIAVTIPILDTVTPQEAQELARAVQQSLDILKLAVDTTRRQVLIKDRISKVRPAQFLFEQLAAGRPQVMIELEFLEVDRSALLSYGFLLPNQFPLVYAGRDAVRGTLQNLARFMTGHTVLGFGIADAQLFARMTESTSRTLLHSILRSADGQPVTFHVGDKFPIATGGLLGGNRLGIPPQFNFEDLGLVVKITPHVHGMTEMTLELEAEFKVLTGQAVNGIPVISNRRFESKVRLNNGEWGLVAGLMSTSEARSISGPAGLATLPVIGRALRSNQRDTSSTDVVLLLKPHLVSLPASEILTRALWVGSESRMRVPM